jgi:hypothetical protein
VSADEEVTKPSAPPQPTTTGRLPAADPILVAIATLTGEVRGARADISLVSNDLSIVKDRVTVLETERTKLSGGVRQLSNADLSKDAIISQLSKKVDDLATTVVTIDAKTDLQTDLLNKLVKLTEKPVVKLVATAIGTAILGYLSAKGLK